LGVKLVKRKESDRGVSLVKKYLAHPATHSTLEREKREMAG
jgi:hypothetical protein